MKKKILVILTAVMMFGVLACGTSKEKIQLETQKNELTETEEEQKISVQPVGILSILEAKDEYWDYKDSLEGHRSTYNQFTIMAENKALWIEDYESLGEIVNYAVVDLDKNGRFELIVSGMGGTGLYTTNRIFEINENYDGLTECITSFEDGIEPDLAYYTWEQYMDENYMFHYVVTDVERNNPYGCYEEIFDLMLENGIVRTSKIATKETIFSEAEVDSIIYTDCAGNIITEEEYENAVSNYFAGCEKTVINIGWSNIEELSEDINEIREQLENSYNTITSKSEEAPY